MQGRLLAIVSRLHWLQAILSGNNKAGNSHSKSVHYSVYATLSQLQEMLSAMTLRDKSPGRCHIYGPVGLSFSFQQGDI